MKLTASAPRSSPRPRRGWRLALYMLVRLRVLWIILLAALCLSGCVRYDVNLRFIDANHGEIVQQIYLEKQSTTLANSLAAAWLDGLERKAHDLGGRSQHPSERELRLTIPFYNVKDLESKFNALLAPETEAAAKAKSGAQALPEVVSRLRFQVNNLVLWQRNRLAYDLDLRSLGAITSETGAVILNPAEFLSTEFRVTTPWGAKAADAEAGLEPFARREGRQLIWQLKPGEVNHIEAVFWLPSPLGIGLVVITLLVLLGMFLKARLAAAPATVAEP